MGLWGLADSGPAGEGVHVALVSDGSWPIPECCHLVVL